MAIFPSCYILTRLDIKTPQKLDSWSNFWGAHHYSTIEVPLNLKTIYFSYPFEGTKGIILAAKFDIGID